MKYFIPNHTILILSVVFSLLFFACSKAPQETQEQQSYRIQVIDGLTDNPIADAQVFLTWGIGGTHVLDNAAGISNSEGIVVLNTQVNQDTVTELLSQSESLDESHVHQSISVEKEGYRLYELFQDSAKYFFRPQLREEDITLAKVYKTIPATLRMIDMPERRTDDVFLQYDIRHYDPKFSFEYYARSQSIFGKNDVDTMHYRLALASGVKYRIDYYLSNVDSMFGRLDTFSSSFIEFVGDPSMPDSVYEIQF